MRGHPLHERIARNFAIVTAADRAELSVYVRQECGERSTQTGSISCNLTELLIDEGDPSPSFSDSLIKNLDLRRERVICRDGSGAPTQVGIDARQRRAQRSLRIG